MTLRLSSACSNQLSYRPERGPAVRNVKFPISNWELQIAPPGGACGGTGTRTPDIQLAKLALYQLSYTPRLIGRQGLRVTRRGPGCLIFDKQIC